MLPNVDSIAARLRLKQLRLLIALDDHGSLHRAADEMSLTQPGATKALREIESTFGATLFVRSAQGIRPNELGRWGWKMSTIKTGDTVTVGLFPLRDGQSGGLIYSVTLQNGVVLKAN